MKKLVAVLIALAMVLSMSVMAFASWNVDDETVILSPGEVADSQEAYEKATGLTSLEVEDLGEFDTFVITRWNIMQQGIYYDESTNSFLSWDDAWTAYYALIVGSLTEKPVDAITEIVNTVQSGQVDAGTAISKVGQAAMGGVGGDGGSGDLSGVVDEILGVIGGIGQGGEGEISSYEYAEEIQALINAGTAFEDIADKIGADLESKKIVKSQLPEIAEILENMVTNESIEDVETAQKVIEYLGTIGGSGSGITFPDFGDIELPWDNGNSEGGSFLDTILGILGGLGDLFNPDKGDGDNNGWGDNTDIPNTGDVSFVAVAAVAAVAGVALVLTRKKDDAE